MAVIHTYDIVDMVIDEAGKKFGKLWELDSGKMDSVKSACQKIDELIERFGDDSSKSATVLIDEETMRLHIELVCNDLETSEIRRTTDHVFFQIIPHVSLFRFSGSKDGETITIDFQFNDIWRPQN